MGKADCTRKEAAGTGCVQPDLRPFFLMYIVYCSSFAALSLYGYLYGISALLLKLCTVICTDSQLCCFLSLLLTAF